MPLQLEKRWISEEPVLYMCFMFTVCSQISKLTLRYKYWTKSSVRFFAVSQPHKSHEPFLLESVFASFNICSSADSTSELSSSEIWYSTGTGGTGWSFLLRTELIKFCHTLSPKKLPQMQLKWSKSGALFSKKLFSLVSLLFCCLH